LSTVARAQMTIIDYHVGCRAVAVGAVARPSLCHRGPVGPMVRPRDPRVPLSYRQALRSLGAVARARGR